MTPNLHIQLLGEFCLLVNDKPLTTLNKPRQQALLAYLLLHRHTPHSRQQIAFSFWPDSSEGQAYTNLRKIVFQLRQALPNVDDFISADTQSLGWREDAAFTLDVAELEQALAKLQNGAIQVPETVERVVALYRGELLSGGAVPRRVIT
jgi:DNA-binding SARP family transcriptional activator